MLQEIVDTTITVTTDSGKLSIIVPVEATVEEWVNNFRVILKWLTYHNDTIKEFLPSPDELEERERDLVGAVKDAYEQERTKKRK